MRCLIVDDEPEGRALMRSYVEKLPFLELKAECSDAFQAMEAMEQYSIELVFLDIQMPGLDGVSFFRSLDQPPNVIFTTAYPEYAVDGFELSAVDYLLKPFPFDRFLKAVNKAKSLTRNTVQGQEEELFYQFKADKRMYRVPIKKIRAIESVGDYTRLYVEGDKHLILGSLQGILKELGDQLIRIHRSHAVNLGFLDYVEGNFIKLDGREIPIGASYKEELKQKLGG